MDDPDLENRFVPMDAAQMALYRQLVADSERIVTLCEPGGPLEAFVRTDAEHAAFVNGRVATTVSAFSKAAGSIDKEQPLMKLGWVRLASQRRFRVAIADCVGSPVGRSSWSGWWPRPTHR